MVYTYDGFICLAKEFKKLYHMPCAFIPVKKGLINCLSKISWTLSSSLFNYMGLHIVNPEGKDIELYNDNGLSKNIIKYTIIIIICFSFVTVGLIVLLIPYRKEALKNN